MAVVSTAAELIEVASSAGILARVEAQINQRIDDVVLDALIERVLLRIGIGEVERISPITVRLTAATPSEWQLSAREREVLGSIADGKSNKEIARILKISDQTVKNHITSILRKLNVNDRTQAVVCAIRNGWIILK